MAIARLSVGVVSRSSGHSAVAKSAYNNRCELVSERYDKREDYSSKAADLLFSGFYPTKDAPDWARSRETFWNALEWNEKRKDAQLGREFDISLPCELTAEQNRWLLQDWVRENFTRRGYVADVAIHQAHEGRDERNIHAHVFVPLRRIEGQTWAKTKDRPSELERKTELRELRQSWERVANRHLERHGHEARIDMRSYAEQGVALVPGVHLGKAASALERRGVETERGNWNREAANENGRRRAKADKQKAFDDTVKRSFARWKVAEPNKAGIEAERERAEMVVKQREGMARQDRQRADHEAENQPQGNIARRRQMPVQGQDSPELTAEAIRARETANRQWQRGTPESDIARAVAEIAKTDQETARRMGWTPGARVVSGTTRPTTYGMEPGNIPQAPQEAAQQPLTAFQRYLVQKAQEAAQAPREAHERANQPPATPAASATPPRPGPQPQRDAPAPGRHSRIQADLSRAKDRLAAEREAETPSQRAAREKRERENDFGREYHHRPFRVSVMGTQRKRHRYRHDTHGGGRPAADRQERTKQPEPVKEPAAEHGFRRVTMTPPPMLAAGATAEQLQERIAKLKELATGDPDSNYGAELAQLRRRHFDITGAPGG